MKALIVYESMFGATRAVAEAVAEGLGGRYRTDVERAADVAGPAMADSDLLVVGSPTHAWSVPRASTRKGAPAYVTRSGGGLILQPGADVAPGVRELLESVAVLHHNAAAFDTRISMPHFFTGRASRRIARLLRQRGCHVVVPPESFLVDRASHLLPGELERARAWGESLAQTSLATPVV